MVKEGKLKPKDIKNDTIIFVGDDNLHYEKFQDGSVKCIEDEIPFEVPEGWAWCRLTEITFEIFAGGDKPENYSKTQTDEFSIPIFANGAENDGLYGFTNKARVNKSAITVSARGTIGFCCIRHMPFVPIVRLITIVPAEGINIEYLRIVFQALIETGEGSSIPQLTVPGIKPKLIPIPPYSEQTRISNKLIETEKIVSAVELNQESVINYIKLAKSKILDLAIRGQLVPQDPNDEPASVLLERIRAEKEELIKAGKIKRDKKESIIFKGDDNSYYEKIGDKIRCIDAEIPFDLPELWTFARLKHIGGIVGGGTPKTNISKYWDGNIPWLTPADLSGYDSMYISTGSRTITDFGLKSSSAQMLPANSILYSSRAPIGYTAIATIPVCTNQGFKSVVPYDFSMSPYLYYCLRARTDNIIQRATGTTFKEISGSEMAETIIPIPPLNEQSKIIEKVTQLQEVISLIEKSLN